MYELGSYVKINDGAFVRVGKLVSFSEALGDMMRLWRASCRSDEDFPVNMFGAFIQRQYIRYPGEYYVRLANGKILICSQNAMQEPPWANPDPDAMEQEELTKAIEDQGELDELPKIADRKEYRATGVEPAEEPFAQAPGPSPIPGYMSKKKLVNHGLIDELPNPEEEEEVPEMRTPPKMPMGGSARRGDLAVSAAYKLAAKEKATAKTPRTPKKQKAKLNPQSTKYDDKLRMPGTEKLKTGPQLDQIKVWQDTADADGKYDWGLQRKKAMLEMASRELLR